jgi:hypothetical protein
VLAIAPHGLLGAFIGEPPVSLRSYGMVSEHHYPLGCHLWRQSPFVSVASGQVTPFGAPIEHMTETNVSPSSQETVVRPVTTRNWLLGGPTLPIADAEVTECRDTRLDMHWAIESPRSPRIPTRARLKHPGAEIAFAGTCFRHPHPGCAGVAQAIRSRRVSDTAVKAIAVL